jgi:hypothetical protein
MSSTTTTITQVLYHETARNETAAAVPLVPLGDLLDREGFAAVDNCGSMGGTRLRVAEAFVRALKVRRVSLWNHTCEPPTPLQSVQRRSTGGTSPESVFQPVCHVEYNASSFVFMTNGEVYSTEPLAAHAHTTSHLPSLFVLFNYSSNNERDLVSKYNVSVVLARHAAARTSAVLILDNLSTTGRLIAVKGDWENDLPRPPPLTDHRLVVHCPTVSAEHLRTLPSRVHARAAAGTIPLSDNRVLCLDALMLLPNGRELSTQLSAAEFEDVARAFLA